MQAYNVEVFDRNFNCIFHDEIDALDFEYKEDYISYTNNKIKVSAGPPPPTLTGMGPS